MNQFIINKTDFEIDSNKSFAIISKLTNDYFLDLSIKGVDEKFHTLSETDDSEWSFALSAPEAYITDIIVPSYEGFSIEVNHSLNAQYDIGLYLMEHCFIGGILTLKNKILNFNGSVEIFGEKKDLNIETNLLIIKDGELPEPKL